MDYERNKTDASTSSPRRAGRCAAITSAAPRRLTTKTSLPNDRVPLLVAAPIRTASGEPMEREGAVHDVATPEGTAVRIASQPIRSPLRHLNALEVSLAAQRESRNRERYLPPTGVYRWWARRTAAVNGAIIDAVNSDLPGQMRVSDPFSGGGVIPMVAMLRGHNVYAQDLNEWAAAGLQAMLRLPEPAALQDGIATLTQRISTVAEAAYGTVLSDGSAGFVSHTFRVAVASCTTCGHEQRLYPHAMVSLQARAERGQDQAYLACANGHLFAGTTSASTRCPECDIMVDSSDVYTRGRFITCTECGQREKIETRAGASGLRWDPVLVERSGTKRRELAIPRPVELRQAEDERWVPTRQLGPIRAGHETRVLLRHGFSTWEDLYPRRQRWVLETLLELVEDSSDDAAVRDALRTAVVGAAEMAGHVSRWDRFYLKSYETMANHRFNFTTFTAEPNVWGTAISGRGTVLRRLVRLVKIADWLRERRPADVRVDVYQGSSERQELRDRSVHLALTDPPYHDDVQYSELSLPLRAWSGMSMTDEAGDAAVNPSVKTNNASDVLSRIFRETARTLRTDGHLIFSFANRDPRAWVDLIAALNRAGLRAVGAEIVHSENEADHAKRQVRACTLDLILDLVPVGAAPVRQHSPRQVNSDEGRFLQTIAAQVLQIGALEVGWEEPFRARLEAEAFLSKPLKETASTSVER